MYTKTWVMIVMLGVFLGSVWFSSSHAGEGKAPSSEALKNIGPALAKAYTSEPIHPAMPDHLWLDEGNDRVRLMMFSKPVSDPTAVLLFVGEGIKGRFCAESQPDGGKTGYSHFHRAHTPAGDTSMSGPKGEEGYWLKHVAVGEFEMEHMHYKPGTVLDMPQPPTPKCK
jgi:hypothetical protein